MAAGTPDVAANPRLHHDHAAKPANHYTHVLTLADKFGVPAEVAGEILERYATAYNRSGIYLSRRDEIPGVRRALLLDPLWSGAEGVFTLYIVGGDGRLSARCYPEAQFGGRYPSLMEFLATEPDPVKFSTKRPDLEMNRFAHAYRRMPISVLHALSDGVVFEAGLLSPVRVSLSDNGGAPGRETERERQERAALFRLSGALKGMGRHRITNSYGLACHAIMEALDPEIARIMRSAQCTTTNDALWLSGEGRHDVIAGPTAETQRLSLYRRQACRTYPALTKHMSENALFNKEIDAGQPLAPAIGERFDLTDREVRILNGLSWQTIQRKPVLDIGTIKTVAKTGPYLSRFNRKSFGYGTGIRSIADRLSLDPRHVVGKVSGLLSGKGPDVTRALSRVEDTADMLQYVVRRLHIPAALISLKRKEKPVSDQALSGIPAKNIVAFTLEVHTAEIEKTFMGELFRNVGLKDLLSASDRWHRTFPAHQERIAQFRDDAIWKAVLPPQDLGGGMTARELTGSAELARQGRKEQHCVGGYTASVTASRPDRFTQIWSIERDGNIIGTLELNGKIETLPDGTRGVVCRTGQIRGQRNSSVEPACETAVEEVLKRVGNAGEEAIQTWLYGVSRARSKQSALGSLPDSINEAGYDFWDDGGFEKVWDELSVYLPRAIRKAGPEAFINSMDGMLKMPQYASGLVKYSGTSRMSFTATSGRLLESDKITDPSESESMVIEALRSHPLGIAPFWEVAEAKIRASKAGTEASTLYPWKLPARIKEHLLDLSEDLRIDGPHFPVRADGQDVVAFDEYYF